MSLVTLSLKKAVIAGALVVGTVASVTLIATNGEGTDRTEVAGSGSSRTYTAQPSESPTIPGDAEQRGSRTSSSQPDVRPTPAATPGTVGEDNSSGRNGNRNQPPAVDDGTGVVSNGSFTITGNVTGLYPGAQRSIDLTLTNGDRSAIRVTEIAVSAASDIDGCSAANLVLPEFVDDPSQTDDDIIVAASAQASKSLIVGMVDDPSNACQNATWTLTYRGQAVKA